MSELKNQLIKLGSTNPELRPHIRPILAEMEELEIRYVIYSSELEDMLYESDPRRVKAFIAKIPDALEAAIQKRYPDANVDVIVKHRVSGAGSGLRVHGPNDYRVENDLQDFINKFTERLMDRML